jgi:hypothetical protein
MKKLTDEQYSEIAQAVFRVWSPGGYSAKTALLVEIGRAALKACAPILLDEPGAYEVAKADGAMNSDGGTMRLALKKFLAHRRLELMNQDPAIAAAMDVVKRNVGNDKSWEDLVPELVDEIRKVIVGSKLPFADIEEQQ